MSRLLAWLPAVLPALLLAACATPVAGVASAAGQGGAAQPVTVTTLDAVPLLDGLRARGEECGRTSLAPVVWQCFGTPPGAGTEIVTLQVGADGKAAGLMVHREPAEGAPPISKQEADDVIAAFLPQVLAEPQLSAVRDWVRGATPQPGTVQGMGLSYAPTYGHGAKFEMVAPGVAALHVVDPTKAITPTMPAVELPKVQAFAEGHGMTCETYSTGTLSCAQKPMYFKSINVSPGKGGGATFASFRFRTGERAEAVATIGAFAAVIAPDGKDATAEWLGRRLGGDGKSTTAAPRDVTFTISVERSAGLAPEYEIIASPALY